MTDPREFIYAYEIASARSPGWYRAECELCTWSTTGVESVVEDAGYEHVTDNHPRRLR